VLLSPVAFAPAAAHAQEPARPAPSAGPRFRDLPRDFLRDQKFLWTRPFRLQRSDLPGVALFTGFTAGLLSSDRAVAQELTDNPPGAGFRFSHRVEQFGGGITDFGIAGAFYLIGRASGNERARSTGILGVRAVANSLIVVLALKAATQRPRPTRRGGLVRNHNADGEFFTGGTAFPSGHAAQAWALAAVVAEQYRHHRWVPFTAYGLAGLVAVSRVTARKHFPSDIFVGSVLGYLIGRYVARTPTYNTGESTRCWQLVPYTPARGAALMLLHEF